MKPFRYEELKVHDPEKHVHYFRNFRLVRVEPTEKNPWGYEYRDLDS